MVGSEGLYRRDYSQAQLVRWTDTLRKMLQTPLPVGTSDTAGALLLNERVIANSDIICYTYYPYFSGAHVGQAAADFAQMHEKEPRKGKHGTAERSFGLLDRSLNPKAHYDDLLKNIGSD